MNENPAALTFTVLRAMKYSREHAVKTPFGYHFPPLIITAWNITCLKMWANGLEVFLYIYFIHVLVVGY